MSERVQWLWVSLPYATYGIGVRGGRVVETAPIAYWMRGRSQWEVIEWLKSKGAVIERMEAR